MSILNLTAPTPLNEVILKAAKEHLTVIVTSPDRKGRREVVIVCRGQADLDRASMANGEAVPTFLGELRRYDYRNCVVSPLSSAQGAEFDV